MYIEIIKILSISINIFYLFICILYVFMSLNFCFYNKFNNNNNT